MQGIRRELPTADFPHPLRGDARGVQKNVGLSENEKRHIRLAKAVRDKQLLDALLFAAVSSRVLGSAKQ